MLSVSASPSIQKQNIKTLTMLSKVGSFSVPRLAIGKRLPQAAVSSFIPPSFPVQPSVFPQPSFSVQPSFLPVPSFASSTSSVHISSPVATILSTSQSYATLSSTFRITSRPVSSSARSPTAGGTLSSSPGQSTLSPAQTPPPSSTQQNAHHLSQGAKIGIGVGAALAAILLAALLIIFVIRRRRARSQDMTYDIYAGATPAPGAMSQIPGSGPYEVSGETTLSQPPQPGIYEIGGSDARPPRAFLRPSRYP